MEGHKNILYTLVVILLILQIVSFVTLSSQVSKTISDSKAELEKLRKDNEKSINESNEYYKLLLADYSTKTQQNINEISQLITTQQTSFDKQISQIKLKQEDFSGIIEDSVKGVVSVGTDRSTGTGFLVHPDGYIVTNQHVIAEAKKIAILTYDKKIVPAEVIGEDDLRDLAIIKAEGGNYNYLLLANSDELLVGRKVIAIGNPLGLSFTVTQGIVSALNRKGPNGLDEYVQTDVSLNPGNSGGPLIDITGKVIGVNNFKVGNAESIGFALESNSVRKVINELANRTLIQ
ncbi:MAG: trypsin-like peptidase domain-containing protein [Nanoarchaeota archaeon]